MPEQYDGDIDTFYHCTTEEAKASILENGFDTTIFPKNGTEGAGGVYFSTKNRTSPYGDAIVTVKFNGDIALADTSVLDAIKTKNHGSILLFLEELGFEYGHEDLDGAIMVKYMQQKISNLGYQGILGTNFSWNAKCKYFEALDASLIEIIL
ncbi:MAG: hypothetical protein LUE64_01600 [Candidatus Gastranaerophilales bacterium]|nr:hypothetical protein [Candidatus Gastranaerophilales bacterium]